MSGGTAQSIKNSWQSRACPADFEIVFVEQGRLECEAWYRARRTTITRWLEECGKARLLKRRAEFVRHQREMKRGRANGYAAPAPKDRRKIDPKLCRMAARHLQHAKHGGWVVYASDDGSFIVGTMRQSPAELVAFAEKRGFDRRRAQRQIDAFDEPI